MDKQDRLMKKQKLSRGKLSSSLLYIWNLWSWGLDVSVGHCVLTLSTCYPFYVVDNASNRYVITADLMIGK